MAENNAEFTVRGLESEDDIQEIKAGLDELTGVMGTKIDRESGATTVKYDVDVLAEERIKITIREMGYDIE